jgi:hypothetical protein
MCNWDDLVQSFWFALKYCLVKWNQTVDDINLHSFPINFDCFFENSNVVIRISILHVCWILKFSIWQFIGWFRFNCNQWVSWWHEHSWIKCRPIVKSNMWIRVVVLWWSQSSNPPPLSDPPLGKSPGGFPLDCKLVLLGYWNKTSLPWTSSPLVTCMLTGRIDVVVCWTSTPLGIRLVGLI